MPLSDREKLLGHSKAQMTQHYTHFDVQRRLALSGTTRGPYHAGTRSAHA
ncbi:MAG: hypothetical protein JO097_19290 [Acidobacteriaceae bacterium]|nr:hypothetical protein [Acidobacteriaceae bacterium]MBV9296238.1 hypothetical protein [Acidobacteriaceae bacterium]MBV9766563.1 hypothetical protein [Acidobacteriaceae bacterium]